MDNVKELGAASRLQLEFRLKGFDDAVLLRQLATQNVVLFLELVKVLVFLNIKLNAELYGFRCLPSRRFLSANRDALLHR